MNGSNKRHLREQVRRFRARFAQGVGATLGEVIPAGLLTQWVTEEVGRWRDRTYGPLVTLRLFLEQVLSADQSCQDAVARGLSERVSQDQAPCSLNSASYCEARKRLPLGVPARLAKEVGARLCAGQHRAWRWRDREVKLVDGTTVSMPDTADNQACFPQSSEQKPGLGFPIARLVAIVSLSCGAVLEWATAPCEGKRTGETALLWELAIHFSAGDVVVADRCYTSYFLIAMLMTLGVDVVMRQHQRRGTDFRRGHRLGTRDHVVTWARPQRPAWMDEATYAAMPSSLILREARAGGFTLVSTFIDPKAVKKRELLDLYRLRWHVELDLRSIKAVMQMEVLRCRSPEMVCKEIAVHLAAYNLVRTVMAQAAYLARVLPRELSFKAAMQLLRAFEQNLRQCPRGQLASRRAILLAGIGQMTLPHRPGRVEPRAVKRRPKPHPLLMKTREEARRRLRAQQQRHIAASLT